MQARLKIVRARDARLQFGIGTSTLYEWIARGIMTPGIPLGVRSVGWPQHELDQIAAARIAGWTDNDIRELVQDLVAARTQAGNLAA